MVEDGRNNNIYITISDVDVNLYGVDGATVPANDYMVVALNHDIVSLVFALSESLGYITQQFYSYGFKYNPKGTAKLL